MRIALLLAACLGAGQAWAEPRGELQVPCPTGSEVTQHHLFGLWRATFDGLPRGATVLLERHPELADSVRGAINRNGERALVAGDVEDGEFALEESADGVRIDATWSGTVVDGSCGREIRGDWLRSGQPTARPFVMRKIP